MSDQPGATGQFPFGKFNDDDEGELRIAVGEEKGVVTVHFGKPVAWFGMTPDGAVQFAQALIQRAMSLGCDRPVTIEIGKRNQ